MPASRRHHSRETSLPRTSFYPSVCKLLDFGVSRAMRYDFTRCLFEPGRDHGTREYMHRTSAGPLGRQCRPFPRRRDPLRDLPASPAFGPTAFMPSWKSASRRRACSPLDRRRCRPPNALFRGARQIAGARYGRRRRWPRTAVVLCATTRTIGDTPFPLMVLPFRLLRSLTPNRFSCVSLPMRDDSLSPPNARVRSTLAAARFASTALLRTIATMQLDSFLSVTRLRALSSPRSAHFRSAASRALGHGTLPGGLFRLQYTLARADR